MTRDIHRLKEDIISLISNYKIILKLNLENKQYSQAIENTTRIETYELVLSMIEGD